jgi:hypothetical protein
LRDGDFASDGVSEETPPEGLPRLPPEGLPPLMPEKLVGYFTSRRPERTADGDGQKIPEGGRDSYLASLGGSMRRRGMTKNEIEAALKAANNDRCDPPLDARDVERIAWSVSRYDHDDPILKDIAARQADLELPDNEPDEAIYERAGFGWLDVLEVVEEEPPPYDWLWTGFIERHEVLWLAGAGKTGKSILSLYLACAMLDERDEFLGLPIGNVENVVYLDGENPEKTIRRRIHLAGVPKRLAPRIQYGMLRLADLGSDIGLQALDLTLRDKPGSLLVLDSLIALHKIDEDNASEVRRFVSGLRAIAEAHGVTIIGLAHENRQGNLRGNLDWRNSADGTLEVKLEDDNELPDHLKWRSVNATERRDGGDLATKRVYTFSERVDSEGSRRLELVTPSGPRPEVRQEEETLDRLVSRAIEAIRYEPDISKRALAEHLGLSGHTNRRFRRIVQEAERDELVAAWAARRHREGS